MTDQENTPTGAIITALAKPAIENGKAKGKAPARKKVDLAAFHKPVQIKQPAAGRWKCDSCSASGKGGSGLLRHSSKSGHRVFTDLDYR